MIRIRHAADRGKTTLDWLDGKHSFSFGHYYDPDFMSFRSLRVINEDVIAANGGFGTHPHNNMEIITYVMDGQLEHKDSEGNVGIIEHGEIQCMSAGTGIQHSEYNPSAQSTTHLYQIWLTPQTQNIQPHYEQRRIPIHEQRDQLHCIASPLVDDGSLFINQDAYLYAGQYSDGAAYDFSLKPHRHAWIQVLSGSIDVIDPQDPENIYALHTGDGLAISDLTLLHISAKTAHEALIFDLP